MSKLKFITMLACVSLTCDPASVSADHHEQHHEEISPAQMLAEFESDAERRRSEEGDHFDEGAYEFERSMMERRIQLEGQRIDINEDFNRKLQELNSNPNTNDQDWEELEEAQEDAFEALDLKFQALDQESQEYWDTRHDDHDDDHEDTQ